jgi:prepilin-type N-terminal cleavage/methylation domain-containing protein
MTQRRRGTSLIEVMVVVALSGIMISATGVCLHGLYRVDQQVRETAVQRWAFQRLSLRFRTDAHAAQRANLSDDASGSPPILRFEGSGQQRVEYRYQPCQIVRTAHEADRVVHTEAYAIERRGVAAWRIESNESQMVVLELARQPLVGREAGIESRRSIRAAVGLHRDPAEQQP